MSEKRLNEELSAVEAALAALKPAASGVDRDRVMFLAGRASAGTNATLRPSRRTHWLWPCTTAVSLLLAITFGGMMFLHGTATGIKVAAYLKSDKTQTMKNIPQPLWYEDTQKVTHEVKRPRPHPSSRRKDMQMDYLSLTMLIADKGVEALPGPSWIPIGPDKLPRRSPIIRDDWNMF